MQNLFFIDLLETFCYKCVHCFTIDLNQQFDICRYCFLLWLHFQRVFENIIFFPFFLVFFFSFALQLEFWFKDFFFICFVWRNIFCTSHHNLFNSFVFRFHVILFIYLFYFFLFSCIRPMSLCLVTESGSLLSTTANGWWTFATQ